MAIDGKTQRSNGNADQKANHIVSAADEDGYCLGQELVDDKSNEKPHEDPNILLKEALTLNDECLLINKINKKNNEIKLANGQTLSEALAERDSIMKKRQLLSFIADNASQRDFRLTHTEIKLLFFTFNYHISVY